MFAPAIMNSGIMVRKVIVQIAFACCIAISADAAEVNVAVAANFTAPMQEIVEHFTLQTGHTAVLSFGASGSIYAQIVNGAPYEVFLSADRQTPMRLQEEGFGVSGTPFTYAVGQLALWSMQPGLIDQKGTVLRSGTFERIALANPKLAPYGAAAVETLTRLGLLEQLQPKFVQGESIAQAYQFIATGNAPLGFVALSQIYENGGLTEGSAWIVPAKLHAPIEQDAVILANGKDNPAATALAAFLQSKKAIQIICSFGYVCQPQ
jgi:molybdate transport system substrate-binding protein